MSTKTSRLLKIFHIGPRHISNSSSGRSRSARKIDPLPTRYGGKTNISVLPGVGIGPEIMARTLEVLHAAEAPLTYEILSIPPEEDDDFEFENALTSIRRNRVALKANIETLSQSPFAKSRNVLLRKSLDLYAYVLPCKTYEGLDNRFGEIDVTVIRQNTEGEYLMLEHEPAPGTVESLKIITRHASEKLAKFAFAYAQRNKRKSITVVHNANIQMESEGLFVRAALDVSRHFPTIGVKVLEVGVLASKLVDNPRNFDIILTTNLNGSLISNTLVGMLGGAGFAAGVNLGDNGMAVFEPGARNKGSSIVDKGLANPIAMIMAGRDLLYYLGYHKTAQVLHNSVYSTLVIDRIRTRDMGGTATSQEITANVIRHVRKQILSKIRTERLSDNVWRSYCKVPEHFNPARKG